MPIEKLASEKPRFDFVAMGTDELFRLARAANVAVYERSLPVAQKVARSYCKRYTWIDADDLTQDLMYEIPRIMYSFREENSAGNPWSKFLYHKLYFKCKDYLRKEDPLGICWPQKRQYPAWHRLGDESLEGFEPRDEREPAAELDTELIDDVRDWREYFDSLPPMRKPKRDRIWDHKRHRIKFRVRKAATLTNWCRERRKPHQMNLVF